VSSIVAVSVDMEGVSQLCGVREIFGCAPEYWVTGKPRLEADVKAACEGLLAGGASEHVVLDNHGGNTINVSPEALPPGARLETWNVYDLRGPVPRRAALGRDARRCDRSSRSRRMGGTRSAPLQRSACENGAPPVAPPTAGTFEASMPNGSDVAEELGAAGWQRVGEVEFAIELEAWPDSREPLAAAMNAALSPFLPYWSAASREPTMLARPTRSGWRHCWRSSMPGRTNRSRSGTRRPPTPSRRAWRAAPDPDREQQMRRLFDGSEVREGKLVPTRRARRLTQMRKVRPARSV
jgi:hypothetical protein